MNFEDQLKTARNRNGSLLCGGIDPDRNIIPEVFAHNEVTAWCRWDEPHY